MLLGGMLLRDDEGELQQVEDGQHGKIFKG
jgi:hypothetical protein